MATFKPTLFYDYFCPTSCLVPVHENTQTYSGNRSSVGLNFNMRLAIVDLAKAKENFASILAKIKIVWLDKDMSVNQFFFNPKACKWWQKQQGQNKSEFDKNNKKLRRLLPLSLPPWRIITV